MCDLLELMARAASEESSTRAVTRVEQNTGLGLVVGLSFCAGAEPSGSQTHRLDGYPIFIDIFTTLKQPSRGHDVTTIGPSAAKA